MRILVLGGTQFVGRGIVEVLLGGGHTITVFNRGTTSHNLPDQVERLCGDRDLGPQGLNELKSRVWDACIDVSGYTAIHVRSSANLLRRNVGMYLFVSAVSVYGNPARGPVDESYQRLPPAAEDVIEIDADTYGPLKVTCENIVEEVFDTRCTLLRPQIIAGPHDPHDRFSYWVRRTAQSGEMLLPGDGSDHLQFIDVEDVARFTQHVCENGISGKFNLSGHRIIWREFADILGATHGVWVPKEVIATYGVTEFELPLFRPDGGPRSSLMHVSNERAMLAGLTLSDPSATVHAVRTWLNGRNDPPALCREKEAKLIQAYRNPSS